MKRVVVCLALLSLVLSGIALAADQPKPKPADSITVGPVMANRYEYISPQDDQAKVPPETVQKLMDQGVIPAVEDAKLNAQQPGVKK